MEITLYNFSKRKNSTKVPTDTGTVKEVKLKGKCDRINPSFFLADVTGYTYLKAWNWYYFITNVAYDINGAQYIDCTIDVLATWKESIMATTAFVKYSSTDYSMLIHDNRVAPLVQQRFGITNTQSIFSQSEAYIISAVSGDGGLVNYYTGYAGLVNMLESLVAKTADWWQSVFASLSDAVGSIISVRAIPITDLATGPSRNVELGGLDLEIGSLPTLTDVRPGYKVDNDYLSISRTYSDFRKSSQFTSLYLYLPFVGVVDLSADDFIDSDGVTIRTVANSMTGNVIYRIGNDDGEIVGTYSGTFGRQIPISNIQLTNVSQSIGHVLSALTKGAGGASAIGSAIGSVPSGLTSAILPSTALAASAGSGAMALAGTVAIGSALSSAMNAFMALNQHSSSVIGGYGGGYGEFISDQLYLATEEIPTRIEPSNLTAIAGNPCLKVIPLTNLSGYVETIGFSIDISAPDSVRSLINNALDNGVYLE